MLKESILFVSFGVEAVAALIVVAAALEAALRAVPAFLRRHELPAADAAREPQEAIRLRLGRWLALALEFELAADILRTGIAPGWNEIGQLGAIIVLRTALNFFLRREIADAPRGCGTDRRPADGP